MTASITAWYVRATLSSEAPRRSAFSRISFSDPMRTSAAASSSGASALSCELTWFTVSATTACCFSIAELLADVDAM